MHGRQAILKTDKGMLIICYNGKDYTYYAVGYPKVRKQDIDKIKQSLDERFYTQKL